MPPSTPRRRLCRPTALDPLRPHSSRTGSSPRRVGLASVGASPPPLPLLRASASPPLQTRPSLAARNPERGSTTPSCCQPLHRQDNPIPHFHIHSLSPSRTPETWWIPPSRGGSGEVKEVRQATRGGSDRAVFDHPGQARGSSGCWTGLTVAGGGRLLGSPHPLQEQAGVCHAERPPGQLQGLLWLPGPPCRQPQASQLQQEQHIASLAWPTSRPAPLSALQGCPREVVAAR